MGFESNEPSARHFRPNTIVTLFAMIVAVSSMLICRDLNLKLTSKILQYEEMSQLYNRGLTKNTKIAMRANQCEKERSGLSSSLKQVRQQRALEQTENALIEKPLARLKDAQHEEALVRQTSSASGDSSSSSSGSSSNNYARGATAFVSSTNKRSSGGAYADYPIRNGDLINWFDSVKAGPGIMKWRHYFSIYEKHFAKFRGTDVHIAEVGIFSGGSMRMHRWYFGEKAVIYGIDISNATLVYEGNAKYGSPKKIFIGDQSSPAFWEQFKKEVPRLDILIDDGGHQSFQQIATMEAVLPHLAPGGILLTEDLHGNNAVGFINTISERFLRGPGSLNKGFTGRQTKNKSGDLTTIALSIAQKTIAHVTFHPFVTVFEKLSAPIRHFYMSQHGSEWQPPEFWNVQNQNSHSGKYGKWDKENVAHKFGKKFLSGGR